MILYSSALTDRIFQNLQNIGGNIITSYSGKSITSHHFSEEIILFAKNLSLHGIKKGDRVGIFINDTILFSEIILATILCWGSVVLLDPQMGRQIITQKIKTSNIRYIFIQGYFYDFLKLSWNILQLPWVEYIIHWWSFFWIALKNTRILSRKNSEVYRFERLSDQAEVILVFTGWTTSEPKWVVHTVASLLATTRRIETLLENPRIFYADLPHFLLLALLLWVKIIAGSYHIPPKKLLKHIQKYSVDTYFSPPYKYQYAIEHWLQLPGSLRNILLGSAPVTVGFLRRFEVIWHHIPNIQCIYGMTEILPIAAIDAREKLKYSISGDILGHPMADINYTIEENELIIQKDVTTWFYLEDRQTLIIPTGDLVAEKDGILVLQWRKKDMIIRKDFNIYPAIYESILIQIPDISEVAFVWVYDENICDEKVALYIEWTQWWKEYTREEISSFIKYGEYSIDSFALPDDIFFMNLPKKWRQQKIDKNSLRNIYKSYLKQVWK